MNIKKFSILILCFSVSISYAQTRDEKIDSLILLAQQAANVKSSDSITIQIISESNAINYTMGVVDGMLLKAANLYNRSKFDEALELLKKWEKPILETKDHVRISQLYALEANSYNSLYFTQKSRNCLLEAKKHAEKIVDDNTRYNNLAKVNMILSNTFEVNQDVKKNFDSILYYRKKAYEIQSKIVGGGILKTGAVIQASAIGNIFLKVDKIDSGKVYFERALSLIKHHQLEKFAFSTYIGLADIHFKNKRLDSALRYYLNAYQLAVKIENTSNIKDSYQKLYRTYMELGDSEKSLFYLKKYSSVADSLAQAGKNATKTSSDFIIADEQQAQESRTTYYILIIASSVLLLLVLIYMFLALRRRHHKSIAKHKAEQEKLYKNLNQVKVTITADKINDQQLREVISLAVANDPIFLIKFKELHPIFLQKLMELSPNLATSDLVICAQLRLGFYTKEIARYTGASVRAIESKKHRIRKKLDIPGAEDINVWMIKL